MGGKFYNLCLIAFLVGVQIVSAYPNRNNEKAVDTYHNFFSLSNDERSFQGSDANDDDMTDTGEMSDLERELIAMLSDEREEFGSDEEESMNDGYQNPKDREMADFDKYNFDEPSLSDFETQHKQNDLSNKDTQFDRGYTPEDMDDEFGENIMPDFENAEYGRNAKKELGNNLFSDYNRNGNFDETGLSDFGQDEPDDLNLGRFDGLNGNNDFNGEYMRSDDFDSEKISDIDPPNDFDTNYKRTDNIDHNPWPADFDEDFLNADNRFSYDNFKDIDFNGKTIRAHDVNNDDMGDVEQEGEYERIASEETNFDNGDITREEDKFDTREGYGIDAGDGDSDDDDELGDEDLEILRRLFQNILEKKSDTTSDLDDRN